MQVDAWIKAELLSRFGAQKYVDWAVAAFDKAWPDFAPYRGTKVRDVPEAERLTLCMKLTAGHESCLDYMYVDSVGLVTAGVGTMIDKDPAHGSDLTAVAYEFPWKAGAKAATREQVHAAHTACKAHYQKETFFGLKGAPPARDYAAVCSLRVTDDEAFAVASKKLRSFSDAMFLSNFPNTAQHREHFPDYPLLAAVVMLDMAFGLGNAGFNRFETCNRKLREADWEGAAKASLIRGASYTTLVMHYMLLKACAGFEHTGAPDGTKARHEDEPPPPQQQPTSTQPKTTPPATSAGAGVALELVLDVPTLSQGNRGNAANDDVWCGRTSAAMAHNYLRRVAGKTDLIVNSEAHGDLVYPDGSVAAAQFVLAEPLERALAGWQRVVLFPKTPDARRALPLDEAQVRAVLQPLLSCLDRHNPVVAYTGLSANAKTSRHLVVFSGYRLKDDALWLHVDDPSTMNFRKGGKGTLLGAENLEVLSEGEWYASGARYWLRARRLFEKNDNSAATDDLWCDHCDRPGLTVFVNEHPTPASSFVRTRRAAAVSLPLDLGGGLAPTPANLERAFAHVEVEHEGGYYPLTANALWHGGVHLHAAEGATVHALADGEVVAARLDPDPARSQGAFGGLNFVIVRHAVSGKALNDAASEPARVGLRLLGDRNLRASASKQGDLVGLLQEHDVVHFVDRTREPARADDLDWHEVVVVSAKTADLVGKRGWVAYATSAFEDVHGVRGAAFDDAKDYPWFSLYLHLAAEPLAADNPRLSDVAWLHAEATGSKESIAGSVGRGGANARADVKTVQRLLNERGHAAGEADGLAGKTTIAAIEAFQKASGLGVDGLIGVGGKTWKALSAAPPPALDAALVDALKDGAITKVGRRVRAGDVLWTVGRGPGAPGADAPFLLHLEAFSDDLLLPKWEQAQDESEDWNVDSEAVLRGLQQHAEAFQKDGAAELARFFREDHDAGRLRRTACRFVSEWAVDLEQATAALEARGWITAGLKERLAPYGFYAEAARVAGGLPDRLHWHYHPLALLQALSDGGAALAHQPTETLVTKAPVATKAPVTTKTPTHAPTETPGGAGSTFAVRDGRRVPHFCQSARPWGERTMGSTRSVREAGSALTAIAMVLKYYGRDVDPGRLDAHLDAHHGYLGNAVRWPIALEYAHAPGTPGLSHSVTLSDPSTFASVLDARLAAGHPTFARVDWGKDADEAYNRFVVIVGRDAAGRYIMNDPLTPDGDGASDPSGKNVIGATNRCGGYTIRALDLFDVTPDGPAVLPTDEAALYDHLQRAWEAGRKRLGADADAATAFQTEPGRVNLLGARGLKDGVPCESSNLAWDDTLFVIWRDGAKKRVERFAFSSEYGNQSAEYYAKKNVKKGGTAAVLVPGYWKYVLGVHKWDQPHKTLTELVKYKSETCYRALNPAVGVTVLRDADFDRVQDASEKLETANYAINIHYGGEADNPANWSEGCQVVSGWDRYKQLIELLERDTSIIGSIKNELAPRPAKDGTRPLIYALLTGHEVVRGSPETAPAKAKAEAVVGPAPRPSSAPYGGHALRKGDADAAQRWGGAIHAAETATHVEALQRDLAGLGYWISAASKEHGMAADGGFGGRTHGAVLLFQREHGLKETGVVDEATASAIKSKPQGSYKRPGRAPKNVPGATFYQLPPSLHLGRYPADEHLDASSIVQDIWGTRAMIDFLLAGGAAWAKKSKKLPLVGDISLMDGGPMTDHKGHQDGQGVDVAGTDGCDIRRKTFDKQEALDLAKTLVDSGAKRILFNCKFVIDGCDKVKACAAHHHHFHVDVVDLPIGPKPAVECLYCHEDVYAACDHPGKAKRSGDELSSG
jgi:peptidoglycan hydrolase-like protein with peptidoglycan-binding domain/GH24 family phage-related lysozyme (muramidase)